jgi:hypothetical protein
MLEAEARTGAGRARGLKPPRTVLPLSCDRRVMFTVLIPARLASTRLPDKPLADIGGLPMVVRVAATGRSRAPRRWWWRPTRPIVAACARTACAPC